MRLRRSLDESTPFGRPRTVAAAARQVLLVLVALAAGCASPRPAITDCSPAAGIEPICGFRNPDDLVRVPQTSWLIVSQFGGFDRAGRGRLGLYDTASRQRIESAYAGSTEAPGGERWGAADCPGPPGSAFNPQGMDLAVTATGLRLLVVNQARATVEFFQVDPQPSPPRIAWKGCVPTNPKAFLNDVAALGEDGFVATEMMPAGRFGPAWALLKSTLDLSTGQVLRWDGRELRAVPGSRGSLPDSIAVWGDQILVGDYGADVLRRIGLDGRKSVAVAMPRPDNLTWWGDRLLISSHRLRSLRELLACGATMTGSCPFGFAILALDPRTLESEILLDHPGGPPIGAGSVAVPVGGDLYLGTFAGDRIARVPVPASGEGSPRPR